MNSYCTQGLCTMTFYGSAFETLSFIIFVSHFHAFYSHGVKSVLYVYNILQIKAI